MEEHPDCLAHEECQRDVGEAESGHREPSVDLENAYGLHDEREDERRRPGMCLWLAISARKEPRHDIGLGPWAPLLKSGDGPVHGNLLIAMC